MMRTSARKEKVMNQETKKVLRDLISKANDAMTGRFGPEHLDERKGFRKGVASLLETTLLANEVYAGFGYHGGYREGIDETRRFYYVHADLLDGCRKCGASRARHCESRGHMSPPLRKFADLGTVYRNEPCREYPGTWLVHIRGEDYEQRFSSFSDAFGHAREVNDTAGAEVAVSWNCSDDDPRVGEVWFTGFYTHGRFDSFGNYQSF